MQVQLFGKLPTHGDFVMRGMTADERDALDRWLSAGLAAARERLGASFDALYNRAPPWRFVVPGETARAGVLVPSVDRAGRRYPIYLALDGLAPEQADDAAERCEALLYTSFAEAWDADRLVAEAATLTLSPIMPPLSAPRWWTVGGDGFAPADLAGERPERLFDAMLEPEYQP